MEKKTRKSRVRAWTQLAVGFGILAGLVFGAVPLLQHTAFMETRTKRLDAEGIDTSALFYTEVTQVGDAEIALRRAMRAR